MSCREAAVYGLGGSRSADVKQSKTSRERHLEPSVKAIRLFYSYSHKDEKLREQLVNHLSLLKRRGVISNWFDRRIGAGTEWKDQIDRNIELAQIILLLVSPDFLASHYCYDIEMTCAMQRHKNKEARVIPVILRPCDWPDAPFGVLQALPKDAKPVTTWSNRDEAWLDISQGIRLACQEIQQVQTPGVLIFCDNPPDPRVLVWPRCHVRLPGAPEFHKLDPAFGGHTYDLSCKYCLSELPAREQSRPT